MEKKKNQTRTLIFMWDEKKWGLAKKSMSTVESRGVGWTGVNKVD